MNRVSAFLSLVALVVLSACGGETEVTGPPSGLLKRVLVSNTFTTVQGVATGRLELVSAEQDLLYFSSNFTDPGITRMRLTADRSKTVVYNSSSRNFQLVDNATEALAGIVPSTGALSAPSDDFVVLPDNDTIFAAVRNAPVSGQPSGAVVALDISDATISTTIPVPHVRRLALSPNGGKLLAFPDDMNSMWVIDTAAKTATRVDGLDRPTWAAFTSDNSRAYVLNCGPECGGTSASVRVLDLTTNTLGASVAVSAATIALLDGSNLYVAGTSSGGGKLDVINTSNFTVSRSGTPIGDGFHHLMTLGMNSKLFVGARTCSGGCLSVVDTSNQNTIVSTPAGDVTGMQPIPDRPVVYVIEGAELV
ncbi:MAG: YncE family protein, partial [Candidatus Korobacteraceae bacterium]